jgi:hypothetical protein
VLIRAADKSHILTPEAEETNIRIGRQVSPGNMPDMEWTIGIWQGCCNGVSFKFFHQDFIRLKDQQDQKVSGQIHIPVFNPANPLILKIKVKDDKRIGGKKIPR